VRVWGVVRCGGAKQEDALPSLLNNLVIICDDDEDGGEMTHPKQKNHWGRYYSCMSQAHVGTHMTQSEQDLLKIPTRRAAEMIGKKIFKFLL
jgi:hypothetical protein